MSKLRHRSMSLCVTKDNNRLSKKFEGVGSDNEQLDSESDDDSKTHIKPVCQGNWTKSDYEVLIEKLKAMLPKKDVKKFSSRMQAIDWKQIEVRDYSPEEVKRALESVLAKIRRFRTLGEMLNDVPDVVNKLLSAEKPKAPPSAYTLFLKDNMPRWKAANMDMKDVFKVASKEFHELSLKKKKKFEDVAKQLKEEYRADLAKFYDEHPDMVSKAVKNRAPNKTPFNLFYSSRRRSSTNLTLPQARKEWEELSHKKKLKYVQESFAAQSTGKWLNKKEQEMLDRFHGKPEYVGRNAFEFFARQQRSQFDSSNLSGKIIQQKIRELYKELSPRQILDLKDEYVLAREQYVVQYRTFIANLPPDKQEAELEHLRYLEGKSTKPKQDKKDESVAQPKEELYPGSAYEDPPVAESTTIKKSTKTKKQPVAVPAIKLEDGLEKSPTKRPKDSSPLSPRTPKVEKPEAPSPLKVETKKPSDRKKKNADVASADKPPVATTSYSKNGETTKTKSKKRTSSDDALSPVEKKPKKQIVKEQPETKTPLMEPEKPPPSAEEFYRQRFYKGKIGKHKESYANLSAAKKREITDQLKQAQMQYITDFEIFLKSLPRDEIRRYIQQANTQKSQTATDDSDEDETEEDADDNNDSSSSSDDESD